MNYEVVDLPSELGLSKPYYKVEALGVILFVQKDLVDSGLTTVEAEIEALCKSRALP